MRAAARLERRQQISMRSGQAKATSPAAATAAAARWIVVLALCGMTAPLSTAAAVAPIQDSDRRAGTEAVAAAERSADDNIVSTIRQLSTTLHKCGVDTRHLSQMRRIMLAGEAKCMDGSAAGYYIRRSPGSRKWIVFLEGGSYCFDNATCNTRVSNSPNLTSSTRWTHSREGHGILSRDAEENPFLFFANVVFVPYCSSDAWTGTSSTGNHIFMGSVIIDEVMVDLLNHGLRDANKLFLTGSSAGATGVLLNIDRVTALLAEWAPGVNVLGIVDSGWFVDVPPYTKMKCTGMMNCAPVDSIKRGSRYWKARIPTACEQEHRNEPWRCFFGYRLYKFIKTPVFIIQYLFDSAQIAANVGYHPHLQPDAALRDQKDKDQYIHGLSQNINHTLNGVAAVFAPSCYYHEILLKSIWYKVAINGISLYDALKCWEESQQATNRVRPSSSGLPSIKGTSPDRRSPVGRSGSGRNSTPRHSTRKAGRQIRPTVSVHHNRQPRDTMPRNADGSPTIRDMSVALKMAGAGNSEMEMLALTNQLKEYREQKQAQCSYRVLDSCESMYCNFKCPNYLALFGGVGLQSDSASAAAIPNADSASSASRDFFSNNR